MPKAAHIAAISSASSTLSKSATSSEYADNSFYSVAIFSGIGLLLSLVAIIAGVQGVWY